MTFSAVATATIFAISLALLIARPRWAPEWAAALGGGLLVVVIGVLSPADALATLTGAWDVLLFFLGLGLAAATADRAGVFRAAAEAAARFGQGSQRRLLIGLYAAGVLVTTVLSNDATALLLTPVSFVVAMRLGVDPRPYAFACALVANAASFVLPVSNPANLLVLTRVPLPLGPFLARLLVPSVLAIAVTLAGLLFVFRAELATPPEAWAEPRVLLERRTRVALFGIALLAVGYVVGSAVGWPLGVVAVIGSLGLLLLDGAVGGWAPRALLAEMPWTLFPLFGGLLLLVDAAERVGLFAGLVQLIDASARLGSNGLPLTLLGVAVLANAINNLPAGLVAATALGDLPPGVERSDLAAAVIVGVNLGPNLTTTGSLATMVWLILLRRRGVEVSALEYMRVGLLVTVPALLAAAGGVWLVARLIGGG
ncbi:MAG TPA: SLC13 family permease [Chloroflexota bacterium]|nr:SLC13 family permease [Chloroflexota bacterium]